MDLAETPDPPPDDPDTDSDAPSGSWLQILANYATLLVAVSAVVLSVWQGYEMRKHNRLSVLPNLEVDVKQLRLAEGDQVQYMDTQETMTEPTHVLKIGVQNTGLGPAVFEKAMLYRAEEDTTLAETTEEGEIVNLYDADSLMEKIQNQFPEMGSFTGGFQQGVMLKAADRQPFLEAIIPVSTVPDTLDANPRRRLLDMIGEYRFVVCYCSVYGENCDQVHIGTEPPEGACDL